MNKSEGHGDTTEGCVWPYMAPHSDSPWGTASRPGGVALRLSRILDAGKAGRDMKESRSQRGPYLGTVRMTLPFWMEASPKAGNSCFVCASKEVAVC